MRCRATSKRLREADKPEKCGFRYTLMRPHHGKNSAYSSSMQAFSAATRVPALSVFFPCLHSSSCRCSPQSLRLWFASYREVRIAAELTLKTLGTGTVSLVASPLAETTVTVGLDMIAVVIDLVVSCREKKRLSTFEFFGLA